jgi:hypothetical protein
LSEEMGSGASKKHESFGVAPARHDVAVTDLYRTPAAFRRALIDRLKKGSQTSRCDVPQLLAQFVYDRLLARVIGGDPGAWVLTVARSAEEITLGDLASYLVAIQSPCCKLASPTSGCPTSRGALYSPVRRAKVI